MNLIEKVLRPGIKIDLSPEELPKDIPENVGVYYHSKITDVRNDDTVEVYMPIEQGKLILLSLESRFDMYCYTPSGIYEGRVIVKERYKNEGLYYVVLRFVSQLRKRQRREHYRYKCMLPLQIRKMDSAEQKWMTERGKLLVIEDEPMESGTVVDISGGGIQFSGTSKYEKDEFMYCKFSFGKEYCQCVKILESVKVENRPGEYRHRAKFIGMATREREEIIQYIFMLERKQRKFEYNQE